MLSNAFMVCSIALLLFLVTADAANANIDSSSDAMNTRDKRAVDFGILLRNLLLKSAQLSSAKYATPMPRTTRTTTTTTTTTTQAPPAPTRRRRPNRPLPPWPGHYYYPDARGIGGGYLPFDYDDYAATDYDDDAEETSTTTTTPRPVRARKPQRPRPPPPPPPVFYRQPYDDDYAQQQQQRSQAAQPPPPRRRRPRPQPQLPPPTIPRQSVTPQLSDNLIYQYAQSNDIYFNNDGRRRSNVDAPQYGQGQQEQESEAEPRNAQQDQEAVENDENGENDDDDADDEEDNLDVDNNNNQNQENVANVNQENPSAQYDTNFSLNNRNEDTRFIIRYVNAEDDRGGSVDEGAFSAAQIQQPTGYAKQQLQDASNIQFGDFQTSYFGESSSNAAVHAPPSSSYYYGDSRN